MKVKGSDKSEERFSGKVKKSRMRISGSKTSQTKHIPPEENDLISKDLYESIMDGITSGVWVANKDDVIYYANKAMEMIAGVTQQKLLGWGVFTDFAENATKYFMSHYKEAKETLQPLYYSEVPVITRAGRQTYQSGWLIPKTRDGDYDGMICTVEDITNQRQTKRALRESEAKYRNLVESANSIIMRMDVEGTITFFNRFAQTFFDFSEDEIIGKNVVGTIVPETEEHVRSIKTMLRDIGSSPDSYANREHENTRKNGEHVWIAWTNRALFDDDLKISEILCIGNDITAQKYHETSLEQCRSDLEKQVKVRTAELTIMNKELQQEINERRWMEEVLRKSEEKYRLVVENANEGIVVNQDGFFKFVNVKAVKIMGHPKEALMSKPFIEFIHPDERDMVMERHLKRIKGDSVPSFYSCRMIDGEGNTKWLEINSVLITWMGRPATLVFFNNITERKKAEQRMHLLDAAIQQAKESIVITSANPGQPSSKIVFVNPAFTNMTGYTAEEVIGKPSLILQGPKTDNTEWVRLENDQSRGKAFYVETLTNRKDGSQIHLEWQIVPLRDERGKVTHFLSIQRDITERKRADERFRAYQEQLRSLASELSLTEERERRRIATELHDHIGQTLAITKIKLGALKQDMLSPNSYSGQIDDIRALVEQTIQYTKSLTFELSPPILYELGFEATIEWLAEQMQKQHYILFDFEDDGIPKPLDRDVSILLFQAVRELFMNIVKHSQAHQVTVSLRRADDTMKIAVQDDGIGFDASKIDKVMTYGFFSIRERLKYFGGTFEIDAKPDCGTRITLTSPLALNAVGDGRPQ
ncbi:MAG: PAS domain S-box protein [Thermodesulfovibrionales bacterium]|jgi:PAS domain S-box-containing protein